MQVVRIGALKPLMAFSLPEKSCALLYTICINNK